MALISVGVDHELALFGLLERTTVAAGTDQGARLTEATRNPFDL